MGRFGAEVASVVYQLTDLKQVGSIFGQEMVGFVVF